MDLFDPYRHALAAMAGFAFLMIVLSALSVRGRSADNTTESGHIKRNYADPTYRTNRAFMNAIEIAGPFALATMTAILVGGAAFWVNLLASLFLMFRVLMAAVHIGTENQALRSLCWALASLCVIGLVGIAIWGAFA